MKIAKKLLTFRLDAETKKQLERAARSVGKSVTAFLLEAIKVAIAGSARKGVKVVCSLNGVPEFFRNRIEAAGQGGAWGYAAAGRELRAHLMKSLPTARRCRLRALTLPGTDWVDVAAWLRREVPECLELVPKRRRAEFLDGFVR